MFFKETTVQYILGLNFLLVAVIYIYAAAYTIDPYGLLFAGVLTILQMVANLVLAFLVSIAHNTTDRRHRSMGLAVKAFLLSTGLVLLVSFPACLIADRFTA
ncbi:MAG: hypothetical protein CFE27_09980 [Alphaproteobacteria bacterium PA1]|nr:MAG: hypothetical protein CFE27_09980 [Alphaproteobacteria bacterium PA1]